MYVVIAYRYGDLTAHHFPVGVYLTADDAVIAAKNHREDRGGKYEHRVFSMEAGKLYDGNHANIIIDTCG